ncbi:MAG: hypothetical protein ACKO5E_13460 [bacterium]
MAGLSPDMPARQWFLDELIALFEPVGPTEQLLIRDIADYRMQLKDADLRRQAVLDSLGDEAATLFRSRLHDEFVELRSCWLMEPICYGKKLAQTLAGLEFFLAHLQKLQMQLQEGRIEADYKQFEIFLKLFGGVIHPLLMSENALDLCIAYISLIEPFGLELLLEEWSRNLVAFSPASLLEWFNSIQLNLPPAIVSTKILQEKIYPVIESYQSEYENMNIKQDEDCRRFAYGYRANREYNESLRNIFADRRTIQQRHDQALRHLTQVQERRRREAARAAERATNQRGKNTAIALLKEPVRASEEKVARWAHAPVRAAEETVACLADETSCHVSLPEPPAATQVVRENATEMEPVDISILLELELGLAEGTITDVPGNLIRRAFQFWPDEDLDCNSKRFDLVFGKTTSQIQRHEVKEIMAAEKSRRHDINKLLDAA